jgi:AmmeMemoRadiSam system protein B
MSTGSPVRHPAVAGRFYPGNASELASDVRSYLIAGRQKRPAIACIAPHAGYIYSGHVAGSVYAALDLPSTFLILGPNHTGLGQPLAIMTQGAWETPLGAAKIATPLAESLLRRFPLLTQDASAHRQEHAIEVQLPFLQVLRPDFSFVPITVGTLQLDVLLSLGAAIAEMLRHTAEPVLLITSSDMNHYESDAATRIKDQKAIDRILALDPEGLYEVVKKEQISMCGIAPTVAMLAAVKQLGATSAELVKYATSGDISGDRNMVVGYAGIVVE